ncbi:Zinc finger protein-like 1, partial [Ameca splendens]
MGLCKCPKRKVTNLFCFEHRVNVCEHCLVSNHNKCIVQSYLQWLQDSDYNPSCALCNNPLATQDTVRLICYDVFHWACLNNLASRLPLHTAPAGYQCPSCQGPVFPPSNLASPVADVLKEQLSSVNWARAGLGLPLIEEPVGVLEETTANDVSDYTDWSTFD